MFEWSKWKDSQSGIHHKLDCSGTWHPTCKVDFCHECVHDAKCPAKNMRCKYCLDAYRVNGVIGLHYQSKDDMQSEAS
ncbi:hypothetical protein GTO91_17015 [Heliobacterium undosum]|uniref:Uncharacterized protein n=1 Tax=Heliomicrobium undosum TaxID=121734 RepID=A0A845LCL0_9FIRM|nr:hypothetical protein [Heliomicrobium undosum]MZP31398.1 hypothetical protein [Heliomicrobium undosum]